MAVARRKNSKKRVLREGEYERQNGTYEFRWRDSRGKRHSVYAKTLEELRNKESEVLRDVWDGIRGESRELKINDIYYLWKQVKRGLKDNTFQNYCYMYDMYVEPDFGLTKLCNLRKTDIRAFYNMLREERALKVSTIDNVHTVLHQVLELAVEDGYIRFNPSDHALKELRQAHNTDGVHHKALTMDEQMLFEEFLQRPGQYNKWYPIFTVMLWTGLRVGEAAGLRWCDVDLEDGIIDVNHTLVYYDDRIHGTGCRWMVNTPKTIAGQRQVPMLPKVKEALLMELQTQREFDVDRSISVDGYTDFIFLNRFGLPYYQGSLNKALRRIIRDCNYEVLERQQGNKPVVLLPRFSNHSLRHTFTTRMCEAGVNIKALQEILGHADAETTMNIYAEATKEFKQSEMQNFASFVNQKYGVNA